MKTEIRKQLKAERNSVTDKEICSDAIAELFLYSEIYADAETLLLYYSAGSEVSTEKILQKALEDKKRVAFPVCIDSDGYMEFFSIDDESQLVEGMYGIKAPMEICEKYTSSEKSLLVVPAIAFDRKGYRIGYGKGYYDRFLAKFQGISVGLCYETMIKNELPIDNYDKKVDYLISDKKIYKFL